MRLFHDDAGLGKALGRLARDRRHFRIDRRDAEIGRIGDALRPRAARAPPRGRRPAPPAATADRPACSPDMASSSSARSSTLRAIGPCADSVRSILALGVRATRPTLGRMPTMPQKLAGLRKRTAHVAAMREPGHAGRQRHRRAARGAGGRARGVPRIAREAEHLVEGVGAGAEFRRVRLGVDHAAVRLQMLDQDVGALGHVVLEDRRAVGGAHAGDVGQVLDRHRHAGKQPALLGRQLHQPVGMGAGAREAQRRQRVDRRVDRGDARLKRVEQVVRRDLPALEPIDQRAGVGLDQFLGTHGMSPGGPFARS